MVDEKKIKTGANDDKLGKVWKHVGRTIGEFLWCAVIAGVFPILPLVFGKLFGYNHQGDFLTEWCGFFFGLTGADHVFEVLFEEHKGVWKRFSQLSSFFLLLIYLLLFTGLTICEAQVNVPECKNAIITIGIVGAVTTCINKGMKGGKEYVTGHVS